MLIKSRLLELGGPCSNPGSALWRLVLVPVHILWAYFWVQWPDFQLPAPMFWGFSNSWSPLCCVYRELKSGPPPVTMGLCEFVYKHLSPLYPQMG